jgi:hypothetical protein
VQAAGGEQQQAQSQIGARAHGALMLHGIGVDGEHVQQADRQGHGHAAERQAQEHRPRPPVLDQQQIDGQQLRVQRRPLPRLLLGAGDQRITTGRAMAR